jgi:replicative DNA helicase
MQELRGAIFDTVQMLQLLSGPNRKDYLGVPTGFSYLDHLLTGLARSDLVILAARPGMGKTSLALNIAMNVAKEEMPVAIFSLEMTKEQLAARILSAEGRLDHQIFRMGVTGNAQTVWDDVAGITEVLGTRPVYLDDTSAITVPEMKSKIREVNNRRLAEGQKKLGLIIIDYLQLMSSSRRIDNRVQEVSEITRSLKLMAKDLQAPVLVLSQLSRSTEKGRPDHRPMLSDLRDSGSIEQDADIVLFLYREAYYVRDDPEVDMMAAECMVAKNRHGETGTVNMVWDGGHTRFYEPETRREDG